VLLQVYSLHIHSAAVTAALYNTIDPKSNVYYSTHPIRQVNGREGGTWTSKAMAAVTMHLYRSKVLSNSWLHRTRQA
jgi:hypothetical protein